MVLASVIDVGHLVQTAGYPLLFVLVMAESGGVPVPGETALLTGAVLASQGEMSIPAVIAVAAAAAIVGDNIGYLIGQRGGRWLLQRPGPFLRHRKEALAIGEPFFERHGPKAVFFGRFLVGLRTWASWLAGATRMRWSSFVVWNALGGICWATGVGLIAYYVGHSANHALSTFGIFGLVAFLVAAGGAYLMHRRHRSLVESQRAERSQDEHSSDERSAGTLSSEASSAEPSSAAARSSGRSAERQASGPSSAEPRSSEPPAPGPPRAERSPAGASKQPPR